MSITSRGAIVAGAGGGIGSAVVNRLSEAGWTTIGVDRRGDAIPDRAIAIEADLTDPTDARRAFESATRSVDSIGVVVNAVGASGRAAGDGPVDEITDDGWAWTIDVNLTSAFHVSRHSIAPLRAAGGGSIVHVSSVLGLGGDPQFTTHAYAASKGAVISLARSMAVTYAPERIRVNVVCPGLIATPMSSRAANDPAIVDRLGELQPLTGTMGSADDVAAAVHYLSSDDAAFVTGAVLTVDGGWTAR